MTLKIPLAELVAKFREALSSTHPDINKTLSKPKEPHSSAPTPTPKDYEVKYHRV